MLEWNLLEVADENNSSHPSGGCGTSAEERNSLPLQIATTLQSTESGRRLYFELCDRQLHLKELVISNITSFVILKTFNFQLLATNSNKKVGRKS